MNPMQSLTWKEWVFYVNQYQNTYLSNNQQFLKSRIQAFFFAKHILIQRKADNIANTTHAEAPTH